MKILLSQPLLPQSYYISLIYNFHKDEEATKLPDYTVAISLFAKEKWKETKFLCKKIPEEGG